MKIIEAFQTGFRNVNQLRRYVFVAYGLSLLIGLILASAIMLSLQQSIGNSLAGDNLVEGFDALWFPNFASQAQGLASTFDPGVVGIGAVFNGLEVALRGDFFSNHPIIVGMSLLYLLTWTFLSGGFIALFASAEDQPLFFQNAARFFPRILVLSALAGVFYFLIFKFVLAGLTAAVDELTHETIDERIHFSFTLAKYAVIWALVLSVNLLTDYNKIFTVITGHKNAATAPWRAVAVVFKNFSKIYGLYFGLGTLWVLLLLIYWLVAPGAGQSSWLAIVGAFLLGQTYVICRVWMRCLFYAGQTAMCGAILNGAASA